jgi:hypothetical protein
VTSERLWRTRHKVDVLTREVMAYLSGAQSAADGATAAGVSPTMFVDVADGFLALLKSRAQSAGHHLGPGVPSAAESMSLIHAVSRYLAGTASLRESARRAGVPKGVMARVSSQCISSAFPLATRALVSERRAADPTVRYAPGRGC